MKRLLKLIRENLGYLFSHDPDFLHYSIDDLCCPSIDAALLIQNKEVIGLSKLSMTSEQLTLPKNSEQTLLVVGSCLVIQSKELEME